MASFGELCGGALVPARVTQQHRQGYRIETARGGLHAKVSGRLRHEARTAADLPAVGDWVGVVARPEEGKATVCRVLPRETTLLRNVAGRRAEAQVLAANVDRVLLVSPLDGACNPRRLERLLAMVWESGAQPLIVLSKRDLCGPDRSERVRTAVEGIACGAPVLSLSARTGAGVEQLAPHVEARKTIALIGMSGVGKSTLINALAGEVLQKVHDVRDSDGRGRHTTTSRQLRRLKGGALLIDTPGLREIALWDASAGVDTVFGEIEELAAHCRFRDCTHRHEPGCAVRRALDEGTLEEERFSSYTKLRRELSHHASRLDGAARQAKRLENKRLTKTYRDRTGRKP